jgi:fibronectin type 3 domain-containing protein
MARALVIACIAGWVAACVNLNKPPQVEECASKGKCVNDAAADGARDGKSPAVDGAAAQDLKPTSVDGSPEDAATAPDAGAPDVPMAIDSQKPDGPAGGPRDLVSIDVPAGACLANGKPLPAGTVCRPAVDLCDVAESCDGVSADCPADKLAKAGASCRPTAGDCDIAETCDGISPSCPVDGFKQAGIVCRKVADVCDVPESCTGTSPICPVDSVAAANTVCNRSKDNNQCDPTETCTGTSVTCPTDLHYDRPAAPANPTATPGTLQATVAWSASTFATGYNVKRSATTGAGYTTLGGVPTVAATPNPSYLDKGLTGGIPYYYVVSAINTIATCESANSAEVAATPVGLCTPPAAPTVTATPGNGTVQLVWAQVAGAVSYSIARSSTSGTGYATIAQVSVATTTTYTDSNVANGTTYYYVLTASNGTCSSVNSAEVSAAPACTAPASPAGLAATPGDNSVVLTWTASPGAVSYSIYRKLTSDPTYKLVNSTSTTTFTDTAVANGTAYSYVVTASNGSCSSANSTEAPVTPACVPPAPPTGVTATPGDGQITLAWTASTGATSYQVSRNTTGTGSFSPIGQPTTTTNYLDQPVTNGSAYYYVVVASNGSCSSANSAVASATPVCTPPSVPGPITATAGDTTVTLSWGASTPAPASYTLQRKTGASGTWATIASPTVASYSDSGLTNATTYFYQVSAGNGSCSSAYNTAVSATPGLSCAQTAPTNPKATATGSVQITLTWSAASATPSGGYNIARSTASTTGFASVGTVSSSTLTYVDSASTLAKNTVYYYQITAVGATCTATSSTVSATTVCSNPAVPNPSASADASGDITITWTAIAGATAYTVYRSDSSSGTFAAVSSGQTAATYTDTASGLTNGNTYYYKVSASNAAGQCASGQSSAVSARACTIPAVPAGLAAMRSGHTRSTLTWTNSSVTTTTYNVLRSTTSGSGYTSIGISNGSPFTDSTASDGTPYFYVLAARSDSAGNCSSANSAEVSVPSCTVVTGSGSGSAQAQNQLTAICFLTCDKNIAWWTDANLGSRKLYVNTAQVTTSGAMPLPAANNSGYAFYFTPSTDGTGNYVYWNYGGATGAACP